jgi:hypothetical protein
MSFNFKLDATAERIELVINECRIYISFKSKVITSAVNNKYYWRWSAKHGIRL